MSDSRDKESDVQRKGRSDSGVCGEYRVESDLLGDLRVPIEAYYGIQTFRAVKNFRITDIHLSQYPCFVRSLAMVKKAAARANTKLGLLKPDIAAAIYAACDDVITGKYCDQFVVDMMQGGASVLSD